MNSARKVRAGADVIQLPQHAVVIDGCSRVDNASGTQRGSDVHDSIGHDNRAFPQRGAAAYDRGWMDDCGDPRAKGPCLIE